MNWIIVNYSVDFAFFIDIIINFFSEYQVDYQKIVDDLKSVNKNYLFGWFVIDFISIFQFTDVLQNAAGSSSDINGMAKITRIGRMYKLVKLTRLLRILKILKARSKVLKYA